jgi:hypothetical protein
MPYLLFRPGRLVLLTFCFAGSISRLSAGPALAVNGAAAGLKAMHELPAVKLRGYGLVSGQAWSDGAGGSLVEIDCADAEHARLLQAKYLSDLGELPPATTPGVVEVNGARITIQTADNVGAVAAMRAGTTVVLAAAPSGDALGKMITADVKGTAAQWTSVAEGKVPMFLDRFDKYGFRFYYAPGNVPQKPGGGDDDTYDVRKDFEWMQSVHSGLTVWTNGAEGVTPEWLTADTRWQWALGEAQQKGLPFGVNLGIDGAAYWFFNRNPEVMMPNVPDFLGTYYGSMNFGIPPYVSWCSQLGQDTMLAQLQQTVRKNAPVENITSWLEPHEELGGGIADMLDEYGPTADASFRDYLQGHYKTLGAVSQRYDADPAALKSWNDIHAPEPATFLGWSSDALDLSGTWKISYDAADNADALGVNFDDSSWGEMEGPGNGLARMLPQKPAIWRRHFNLDSEWQTSHQAIWLYVFDLNDTRGSDLDASKRVIVSVNGKAQAENQPYFGPDHWAAYNVTQAIQAGDNVLAVRLPRGLFNYRVYLSGDEPKAYPQMAPGKNALWTDFVNWLSWSRGKYVGRGMQMIRQADPNRGIVLMAPDSYEDDILEDAIAYGGDFHNTGYMGGWWCDKEPALMRGAGLPFSTEPSQGPTLPNHILGEMGNWITQGVNAIDHFQTIGEVLYHPDLKKTFEDHVAMYTAIGRWHAPFAQIAVLYSNRVNNLFGWPFAAHPASDDGQPFYRGGSYPSGFNIRGAFTAMENDPPGQQYESDAVKEMQFARDQVDPAKYHVVVDTDTAEMDDDTIAGIERYVRAGGVFVTYGDTGRHSSDTADAWPIERLTGFHVVAIKPTNGTMSLDAGQTIFPIGTAFSGNTDGLHLNAVAPDAKSVLNWNDGSVAVGMRPLGKGFIVQVGPYFGGKVANTFFAGLFQWLKIDPEPATLEGDTADKIFWRRFVSNNGLYDLWTLRNRSFDAPQQATLQLDVGMRPPWMVDLTTGTRTAVTDGKLPVNLPPGETVQLIVPRANVGDSTSEWFALQRGWWQGTSDAGAPFPKPELKNIVDLSDGWAFQPVDANQTDASQLIGVLGVDDSAWPKLPFGIFTLPDHPDVRHFVVRRHIEVPAAWNHGETSLHLPDFRGWSQVYLDGKPLRDAPPMAAGSTHILAIEMKGNNDYIGSESPAWISYHPDVATQQNLTGPWQVSSDDMNWPSTTTIPGPVAQGTRALRATMTVDRAAEGSTVVLHGRERSGELHGVVINGTYVAPQARESGDLDLNITPWVLPGRRNEFILLMGGSAEDINTLTLEFHPKGTYP